MVADRRGLTYRQSCPSTADLPSDVNWLVKLPYRHSKSPSQAGVRAWSASFVMVGPSKQYIRNRAGRLRYLLQSGARVPPHPLPHRQRAEPAPCFAVQPHEICPFGQYSCGLRLGQNYCGFPSARLQLAVFEDMSVSRRADLLSSRVSAGFPSWRCWRSGISPLSPACGRNSSGWVVGQFQTPPLPVSRIRRERRRRDGGALLKGSLGSLGKPLQTAATAWTRVWRPSSGADGSTT